MSGISEFERHQIESLLLSGEAKIERDTALFLGQDGLSLKVLYEAAVRPALMKNGIGRVTRRAFDSDSSLAEVCRWALSSEVIVAEVDRGCADLMYVVGLCHGLRRCPLLIHREEVELPFNLQALRCAAYRQGGNGLVELRKELTRMVRVFLAASRAGENG